MQRRSASPIPLLATLAVLAAVLPVALARIPGFTDMPSHMARHHVLALAGHNAAIDALFRVDWRWIANLGVDLPAVALTPLIGTEAATRLIAALIAPLTVVGMFALSRAVHGRIAPSAFVALALVFNQAWMWGFQNFGLGTALALIVAAWMLARPMRGWVGQVWLAALALVIWTAHLGSWGILLVIAAGQEVSGLRTPRDVLAGLARTWPLFAPVVPLLLWRTAAQGPQSSFQYGDFIGNKAVVFAGIFKGTYKPFDLGLLAALLAVGALAFVWARRGRVDPRLATAGVLMVLATLAAPITIVNAWGTDLRCAPIAVMLLIVAIRPPVDPRRAAMLVALGLALFTARLGVIVWDWTRQSHDLEARLTLLDAVPVGSRVGYVYLWPRCGFLWHLDPETKLGSYAVTRRDGFASTMFQIANADIVTLRDTAHLGNWHDGTQSIMPLCPSGRPDVAALRDHLAHLHGDGIDAAWISGLAPADLPRATGFHPVRSVGHDTLMLRD